MASHSHSDGSGRETEDDDMSDIWPHAIDAATSSSSAAPAAVASGSDTVNAEPNNDTMPIATMIGALCIDPVGSDAPIEDRRMPRSPAEPPVASSSKPSDEELAIRQTNMLKLRAQMDAVQAERIARGIPLPVKASPPHRATVEEQQAIRDRQAAEEANALVDRKKNLAAHGPPNLYEKSTDFLERDSEEEQSYRVIPSTNAPREPAEPMAWPTVPPVVMDPIDDGYRRILLTRLLGVSLNEPPYQLDSEPMTWCDWLTSIGHTFLKLNRPEQVASFGQLALSGNALADTVENMLRHKSTAGCAHLNHAAFRSLADPRGDGSGPFMGVTPNQCLPDLNCTILDFYSDSTVLLEKWVVNKYVSTAPVDELRAAFHNSQQISLTATAGATADDMTRQVERDNEYREKRGTVAGRKTTSIKQRTVGVIITCLNDAFGSKCKFVATSEQLIDDIVFKYRRLLTTLTNSSRFVVLCITEDTRVWGCHQDTLIEAARRIASIARRMGALVTTTDQWYCKLERRNPKA